MATDLARAPYAPAADSGAAPAYVPAHFAAAPAMDLRTTLPAGTYVSGSVFTVRDLSFTYKGDKRNVHQVFDGLSLSFAEGRITTLIGANGSGKSTLFNLMTKNLVPTGGMVYLRRGDVAAMRLRDFAKIVAIVHQRNTAPADITVERLVGYGRSPYRQVGFSAATQEDEDSVAWALDVCDLTALAMRPVAALSGGQVQRTWIAMALAQRPQVLLLDEPTTYLDVRYQVEVLRLVRRLNREFGITVIMVLHDVNQAMRYSDEIVALAHGRLCCQGAPEDVISPATIREVYGIDLPVVHVDGRPYVLAV